MKFLVVIVVALTAVSVIAKPSEFKDCGPEKLKGAKIAAVDITPCQQVPGSDVCGVLSNKTASISLSFHALKAAATLKAEAYGSIAGIRVPYPLPQPDACVNSNLTCPLAAGKDYVYTTSLTLPIIPSQIAVMVEIDLIKDGQYACVSFPLVVQPSGGFSKFLKDMVLP